MRKAILLVLLSYSLVASAQVAGSGVFSGSKGGGSSTQGLPNVQMQALLTKASTTPVNVIVAGDSFTVCDMTNCAVGPTTSTNRWVEQLRTQLQSKYGSHGTGIVPILVSVTPLVNNEAWTCVTPTNNNVNFGPNQSGTASVYQITSNTQTCTFHDTRNIVWDTLVTYCATATTIGNLQVSIDGGAAVTVCSNTVGGPSGIAVATQTVTTPSANHTAVYTSTGGVGFIYAAEGLSGTQGVSVSNVGVGGALSTMFGGNVAVNMEFFDLHPGGTQLFIYQDQTNDVGGGSGFVATFTTNIQNIITHEAALSPVPEVMLAIPPMDVVTSAANFAPYTAAQKSLCKSNLLNCVSMADAFGPYAPASGLWDLTSSNPGVHPNDLGNAYEYQLGLSALMNDYSAVVF